MERTISTARRGKKRIQISSAKAKGRWLQNWVAKQIEQLVQLKCGYDDDCQIQPRIMGQKGVDVVLRGDALLNFPYAVECASGEYWSVMGKIKQAKKNLKPPYRWWLLFLKSKSIQTPIVIMDASHFFELIKYSNVRKHP